MLDHIHIANSRIMLDHIDMVGAEFSICRFLKDPELSVSWESNYHQNNVIF